MKQTILLIAALLCMAIPAGAKGFTGYVLMDTNNDNAKNSRDKPLAGVVVTDGFNVTRTDSKGYFELPGYENTRFITVTTPAGYKTQQHYIRVDAAITSYDFLLTEHPAGASNDHSFIQITDTEIGNKSRTDEWVNYLKQFIATEKPAFLFHTGDICYEEGLKRHITLVNQQTMGCPVYYSVGNHDLVKGDYGEQLFESVYGPSWFSFDAGNVHYIVLPMPGGDHRPHYTRSEVYQWVKNDLAMKDPAKQLVIFNHDLLTTTNDFLLKISDEETIDLRQFNLRGWIYGHYHFNYVRNQGGVYTICTNAPDKGGIDHSPSAFRHFRMDSQGITSRQLHYTFMDKHLVVNTAGVLDKDNKITVSANAYHSASRVTAVNCKLKSTPDSKSYSLTQNTDWNWSGEIELPASSKAKEFDIEVTARFSDGKEITKMHHITRSTLTTASMKTGEPWTNLLGNPTHTGLGVSDGKNLQTPSLSWLNNVGANIFMASPLIVDNQVFVATTDDNDATNAGIVALETSTGKILWKCPTRNSVKNSIAYDNKTVLAQDASGYLYAIDATTGKLKWEKNIMEQEFPYIIEGIAAKDGIVYAGTGLGLGAYKIDNGEPIWQNTEWRKNEGATNTITLANSVLVTGSQWGALYGHNAQTNKLMWTLKQDGLSNRGSSPVLYNNKLYLISRKSLFEIEPLTGTISRQQEYPEYNLDVTSTPLVTPEYIAFGTADAGLLVVDADTWKIRHVVPANPALVYTAPYTSLPLQTVETSPLLIGGTVYYGASDGVLYGVNPATGEKRWTFNGGAPFFATPAVSGNVMIATDFAGNVYGFVLK